MIEADTGDKINVAYLPVQSQQIGGWSFLEIWFNTENKDYG